MSDEPDATASPITLGPPWDNQVFDLVLVLLLILIAIAGGFKRAASSKPVAKTIRLAEPQFAPLSEPDAADAARLLGTSLAQLMAEGGEETP